jgi:hypothetical protein
MREFADADGARWIAGAIPESTPRHHGRWFLVLHPVDDDTAVMSMPEVRWQTRATAERTLLSMSEFELRRRLHVVHERALLERGASPQDGAQPASARERTSANAG